MKFGKPFVAIGMTISVAVLVFIRSPAQRSVGHGEFAMTRVVAESTEATEPERVTTPTLVGREVCRECHLENFNLHANSGHASTFYDASAAEVVGKFAGTSVDTGDRFGRFTYETDERGLLYVRHPNHPDPFHLRYALGSGHHGITLLSLVPDPQDQTTMGIEHRVSWFSSDDSFGVTPSQEDADPQTSIEWLGLPVRGKGLELCISCHTTSAEIVDQEIHHLVANVNCEKCHGPGSEHVRQARASKTPPPFSVGQTEWSTESELRLCGSCHRMPKDIPRKLLRDYTDDLTRFQPVGLLRSKCYLESDGAFKCTTCHNPHMTVKAKSPADYVQDCVACHRTDVDAHTKCPVSPQEGCIECHMPAVQLEHFAFHDHWIRVRTKE